jgi:hypothetical protein
MDARDDAGAAASEGPPPLDLPAGVELGAPLAPTTVSELTLSDHDLCGIAHISAASGVAAPGHRLYVVADDEFHLASFDCRGRGSGRLHRLFSGDLPAGKAERKAAKPDLEALALLPASDEFPHRALYGVGSGSRPTRTRGFVWRLDADGNLVDRPVTLDHGPLLAAIGDAVRGELNIEGAAVAGSRLLFLQRGNAQGSASAIVEIALDRLLAAAAGGGPVGADALAEVREIDLGLIAGVPLAFTDGAPLDDRRLLFAAAGEATENVYDDGEIVGSAIGVLTLDGRLERLHAVDARGLKVEGVTLEEGGDGARLLMVTDADDPDVPAALLAAPFPS